MYAMKDSKDQLSINRNIVECKDGSSWNEMAVHIVLIET